MLIIHIVDKAISEDQIWKICELFLLLSHFSLFPPIRTYNGFDHFDNRNSEAQSP